MESLCIKTNNSRVIDYLLNELENLDLNNIIFCVKTFKHYKNVIVHYKGEDFNLFFSKISNILSFLVIDEFEEDFFKKIIAQNYSYFNSNETKDILSNCFSILSEDFSKLFDTKLKILYNCFFEYISKHKAIVLSGFLNFRIPKYFNILNQITTDAVNNFIIEKEYFEFISLLKVYINSRYSFDKYSSSSLLFFLLYFA